MKKITIFTPTYNRAYCLPKLYKSLLKQNLNLFEWIIIDDGSTDNTKSIVDEWKKENKIHIGYYYQNNSGKMSAHDWAVKLAKYDLFMCVDSDDFLLPNTLHELLAEWEKCKDDAEIAGIIAYRRVIDKNGYSMKNQGIPLEIKTCKVFDVMMNKWVAETTSLYRTNVLRQYPFPVIEGEKFISEIYIYNKIDDAYKMHVFRKEIQECRYLNDGYTKNIHKIIANNPKGYILYYKDLYLRTKNKRKKLKCLIQLIACNIISHQKTIKSLHEIEKSYFFIFLLPIGYIYKYIKLDPFLKQKK